jgi:hypothetical protein
MKIASTILVSALAAACFPVGPGPEEFGSRLTAAGASGYIRVGFAESRAVELLTVTDSSYILEMKEGPIVEALHRDVTSFQVIGYRHVNNRIDEATRRRLQTLSRFPYGIPDEAMRLILAQANQAAVKRIP